MSRLRLRRPVRTSSRRSPPTSVGRRISSMRKARKTGAIRGDASSQYNLALCCRRGSTSRRTRELRRSGFRRRRNRILFPHRSSLRTATIPARAFPRAETRRRRGCCASRKKASRAQFLYAVHCMKGPSGKGFYETLDADEIRKWILSLPEDGRFERFLDVTVRR